MVNLYNTQINYRDNEPSGFIGKLFNGIGQGIVGGTGCGTGYGTGLGGFNNYGGWSGSLYGYGFGGGCSVESQCGELYGGVVSTMAGLGIQELFTHQNKKKEALTTAKTAAKTVDDKKKELSDIKKKPLSDYEAKAKEDAGVAAAFKVYNEAKAALDATTKPDDNADDATKKAYDKKKAAVTQAKQAYDDALNKKVEELRKKEIEAKQKEINEAEEKLEEAASGIGDMKNKCNTKDEYDKIIKTDVKGNVKKHIAAFMYEFHQVTSSSTMSDGEKKELAKSAVARYEQIEKNSPGDCTSDMKTKYKILQNYAKNGTIKTDFGQ